MFEYIVPFGGFALFFLFVFSGSSSKKTIKESKADVFGVNGGLSDAGYVELEPNGELANHYKNVNSVL